jgi:Tol biopolymer transport system component
MKSRGSTIKHFFLATSLVLALLAAIVIAFPGPAAARSSEDALRAAATPVPTKAKAPKAATTKAKPAPNMGKIALMTSAGGDILLLDPANGKLQRLTNGLDPAFSPDGTKLAFTRWGEKPGVYVRDMKTGEERMVVGGQRPRHPTWSSSGQKLAFVNLLRTRTCRESLLGCLTDAELGAVFHGQDCLQTSAGKVCISEMPSRTIDETGLVEIGLYGDGWQDIAAANDAQSPSWRPNSEDLLHRGNNRLQVAGPGRSPYDVSPDQWYGSPDWSPDGTKFVAQKRIHDHTDLALFDGSGALLKYLTKPQPIGRAPHNVAPAWSADGKTILFLTDREAPGSTWKLYRMNADGSGQAPFLPKALKDVTFRYDFAAERVASWGK